MKSAMQPTQYQITDFFDVTSIGVFIDRNENLRSDVNNSLGREPQVSVKPILETLYRNAQSHNLLKSKNAYRHSDLVKKFSSSLMCIVGRSGYEFIQSNFGNALPSIATVNRSVSVKAPIKEGEFYFQDVKDHLVKWKCPLFIHVHVDDTRVLSQIEYDPLTGRFVGFCLPLLNVGIPNGESFILNTFTEIKTAFERNKLAKYAHCMVARPVAPAPAFVFFVLGTDSSYKFDDVSLRFTYVKNGFQQIGVNVISFGADGAGPFLKAMVKGSQLFSTSTTNNVPESWTFYFMPQLMKNCLFSQDTVHLLAKMRTRLLLPSNILVLGDETACPAHLNFVLNEFPKEKHGLSARCLDVKDKQNYSSIEKLLDDGVLECLNEFNATISTKGTCAYLKIMKNIRNSFFKKSFSPEERLYYAWNSLFFLRIWRVWLEMFNYKEQDHFVTSNIYVCIEINCHMLLNLLYNVKNNIFPPETLRIWLCGSQACEETFRILRAMTPTFSTIVNFTVKGILQRIHRLNYLSTIESSENITFPRVKRRLLQYEEEEYKTFLVSDISVENIIHRAKTDAIQSTRELGMALDSYSDNDLMCDEIVVDSATAQDGEDEEMGEIEMTPLINVHAEEAVLINEDLANLRVKKSSKGGLPVYEKTVESGGKNAKTYQLQKGNSSPFVEYGDKYIRKSTALYLIQENVPLSNDRLLRVRATQASHLYSATNIEMNTRHFVTAGELCVFRRGDSEERLLLGRVIQFSYMYGNKWERQYTSNYVDLSKDSKTNIGSFMQLVSMRIV